MHMSGRKLLYGTHYSAPGYVPVRTGWKKPFYLIPLSPSLSPCLPVSPSFSLPWISLTLLPPFRSPYGP